MCELFLALLICC